MSENEIAKIEQAPSTSIIQVIERAAMDPNVDIDKMERLLGMQERILTKESELSFSRSMSQCQEEMPPVVANAANNQTSSKYAKFENIVTTIKPNITKHGFSISFGTNDSPLEKHIRITCDVMHRDGHTKNFHFDLPLDINGLKGNANKTEVHATGSTMSYGKRYLILMIFNIAVHGEDDDAVKSGGVTVEKLLEHNAAVREHMHTLSVVKYSLGIDDYSSAIEAWDELTNEEKLALQLAPTKGGMLSTQERAKMKSNEWAAARKGE